MRENHQVSFELPGKQLESILVTREEECRMSAVFVCAGPAIPCRTFSVFVKLSNDLVYPSATMTALLTVCAARK